MVLIRKNELIWWVGLGLWGMRIICMRKLRIICTPTNFISYACKNCVLYAHQTRSYHIYAKVHFCLSIPRVFIFIWPTIYMHFHETGLDVHSNYFWQNKIDWAISSFLFISWRCNLFIWWQSWISLQCHMIFQKKKIIWWFGAKEMLIVIILLSSCWKQLCLFTFLC